MSDFLVMLEDIKLGRGETLDFEIDFPTGQFLEAGEHILMTVRKSTDLSFPVLIEKILNEENSFTSNFTSEETTLDYGLYAYDFWHMKNDNKKVRLCLPSNFIIEEVVGNVNQQ
jgi:hypothetical protein